MMIHRSRIDIAALVALGTLLGAGPAVAGEVKVERHPLQGATFLTLGQLVKGRVEADAEVESQFFTRTGAGIRNSVTIADRLNISIALGGLFYQPLPELTTLGDSRNVRFGPGLDEVMGAWNFGDPTDPAMRLQWGLWHHKYNPDAKNFGEYLFRSGTYMPYLWSGRMGSWTILNSHTYWAQGLKFDLNLMDGRWTNEFSLFMARDVQEIQFDLSPAWISTFKVGDWMEFGAGVQFAHGIPIRPSKVSQKTRTNAFVRADAPSGVTYTTKRWVDTNADGVVDSEQNVQVKAAGNILPKGEWTKKGLSLNDPLLISPAEESALDALKAARAADANPNNDMPYYKSGVVTVSGPLNDPEVAAIINGGKDFQVRAGQLMVTEADNGISRDYLDYYTYQGIKAMGRFAFYPAKLIGSEALAPKDLALYGEVGLLGFKDYPYFYEKKSDRMPIMIGFNVPTFKLLDVLAFEYEIYPYPFNRNIDFMVESALPRPQILDTDAQDDPAIFREAAWKTGPAGTPVQKQLKLDEDEKTKWTLYARKSFFNSFSFTGQVARDHYRAISITNAPHDQPWTRRQGEWYYAVNFEQQW